MTLVTGARTHKQIVRFCCNWYAGALWIKTDQNWERMVQWAAYAAMWFFQFIISSSAERNNCNPP